MLLATRSRGEGRDRTCRAVINLFGLRQSPRPRTDSNRHTPIFSPWCGWRPEPTSLRHPPQPFGATAVASVSRDRGATRYAPVQLFRDSCCRCLLPVPQPNTDPCESSLRGSLIPASPCDWWDSNPRHPGPQPGALDTAELQPPSGTTESNCASLAPRASGSTNSLVPECTVSGDAYGARHV